MNFSIYLNRRVFIVKDCVIKSDSQLISGQHYAIKSEAVCPMILPKNNVQIAIRRDGKSHKQIVANHTNEQPLQNLVFVSIRYDENFEIAQSTKAAKRV